MNDFDGLLGTEFGYKPRGKSAPMAGSSNFTTTTSSTSSVNFDLGPQSSSSSTKTPSADLDSVFRAKSVNFPVYDDDDIFDGVPGLRTSSSSKLPSYDDVFASPGETTAATAFDDLLGGFGQSKSSRKELHDDDKGGSADFDDLIPGFGSSTTTKASTETERPSPDIGFSSESTVNASKMASSAMEDPFKVFESASAPIDSSSGHFTDPLDEISKFTSSRSTRNDKSSNSNGVVYDDTDHFDVLGNSVPAFSSERNSRQGSSSPTPRSNTSSSWTGDKESFDKSSVRSPETQTQNKIPVEHDQEFHQAPYDMPTYSTDSTQPAGQRSTSPSYDDDGLRHVNTQADMSPRYEENLNSNDDIWLVVSEIPLFTQPTAAPQPSRPPPPRPVHIPKSGTSSSASANARKKDNEFSSFPSSTRFSQNPKSAPAATKFSSASQFDEVEDFAMGKSHGNDTQHGNGLPDEEIEMNSAAAAMKEAMDRAEAKLRHAKEVRERENTKAARSKEHVQVESDSAEPEERGNKEWLDHERLQKEREENEQRKLQMEREEKEREQRLESERQKARQAVERATREARERAAAGARQRAERAAVERANSEARGRAERTAVQRVQAEARERAAAEAKVRAEKAAAQAKERETREKVTASDARIKAERAAVERATMEARERAAASTRMSQQKNENDFESFFSTDARANSAPRPPRASSSDSAFDSQFQSDVTRKSTSTSSNMKKESSSTNIVDDLSSIFGASPSPREFQEVEGESEERRKARLERLQRAQERAAKALDEKNQRDLQTQREQAERHRLAETLDFEVKRWAAGKEANLRALLSTLQYVLWSECGWQPVSLTDLITAAAVKKAYRKATLCIHPDKVQQKGATLQQKYIAEKVFDLLKEAWNKFNSEELF